MHELRIAGRTGIRVAPPGCGGASVGEAGQRQKAAAWSSGPPGSRCSLAACPLLAPLRPVPLPSWAGSAASRLAVSCQPGPACGPEVFDLHQTYTLRVNPLQHLAGTKASGAGFCRVIEAELV